MGFNIKNPFRGERKTQQYSPLGSHDVEVSDSSSASEEFPRQDIILQSGFQTRLMATIAASVTCTLLVAVILVYILLKKGSCASSAEHSLMKTPIPSFPKEIRYFEWNQTFIDPPNPEGDRAWDMLLPDGRGYIYINNGAQYGLEPGVEKEDGEIYAVSMFHQIHCLGTIRRNYYNLVAALQNGDDPTMIRDHANRQIQNEHTGHCFDYLRQAFECSADMTVEWPRTEEDGRRYQVDGKGIPHVCTSKTAIRDFMEVHGYHNAQNHDIAA